MFSRALVICAENNFDKNTHIRKHHTTKHKEYPYFSIEYREAHALHRQVFSEWRKAGRPSDRSHPAKNKVLESRRHLQRIAREENSAKVIEFANDLIEIFRNDINKVCSKLKKYRGEQVKRQDIPVIQTLAGNFSGQNVLEGFAKNTEILCNENATKIENYDNHIYDMFVKDNMMIFDITASEDVKIPHMVNKTKGNYLQEDETQ